MFRFEADLKVFVHREPIDFRAGINSLVALVEQSMQLDPFARAVFAFHNRRRNRVKLLFYERTGFWLMLRRLEQDHFVWPRRTQAVIELTTEELHWLLEGIDVDAVRRHPSRRYRHLSVSARVARITARASSAFMPPMPIDPSAPALDTAAVMAGVAQPSIGA
ncbi:UNVERIFIED_ORG: IS66 Orf2 like protein [Burkholderia sp. CF145]